MDSNHFVYLKINSDYLKILILLAQNDFLIQITTFSKFTNNN